MLSYHAGRRRRDEHTVLQCCFVATRTQRRGARLSEARAEAKHFLAGAPAPVSRGSHRHRVGRHAVALDEVQESPLGRALETLEGLRGRSSKAEVGPPLHPAAGGPRAPP